MSGVGHAFHPSVLREYDIRGVVGDTLTTSDALALGRSLGTLVAGRGGRIACVGYDGRLSSPALEEELSRGLASSGLHVLCLGICPTPALYFAAKVLDADCGVMVTGSHNAPEYNGFKMVVGGAPFFGADIGDLAAAAARGAWVSGDGSILEVEALDAYVNRILADYGASRGLRVAWDAGNGAAGHVMLQLAQRLPGDHFLLNEKIDGTFPAHHPDPTVEANLVQLRDTVLEENCDLGVAFDGDGDRIGVLDERGRVLWGDQLLAILARDVLQAWPGANVIGDVKASQLLFDEIRRLGGTPVMCQTGHSIIKKRMVELQAPLAGEMSGHIFFADHYYGYDDALYATVRLIDFLARSDKTLGEIRDELPVFVNTPEIRLEVAEERKFELVDAVKINLRRANAELSDLDGVRVKTDGGWWLLRASNTQNALVVRCEARDQDGLVRQQEAVVRALRDAGMKIDSGDLVAAGSRPRHAVSSD